MMVLGVLGVPVAVLSDDFGVWVFQGQSWVMVLGFQCSRALLGDGFWVFRSPCGSAE